MDGDRDEIIRIEDLCVGFDGKPVLNGLDLSIFERENFVLIGRSGCGKSVLLRHILGLLKPDSGRIYLWGTDIVPLSEEQLTPFRRRMAIVFQAGALFNSMTVGENISLGLDRLRHLPPDKIRETVHATLNMVDLKGVETLSVNELSGGMKKRVAIARAIALDPEILFFDEPTTGLDPSLADTIDELIYRLSRNPKTTTITVTHDMVAARYFGDRIALMDEGRIVVDCPAAEIEEREDPRLIPFLHRKEHPA